ncbi:DUF6178 family protein [Desulfobotulus sp.]|jgi:hypothetical protein|uniref:DUF6178 family protein n=1 Tax=Desulfobotulus sp. TaxID=1940337 RepID=UPI002A360D6D|nr:DUF6178 family protein [Desulfobotulus sp.]MDY0163111.1 DUF6178 family protein [Desulfobotulus sp.]
MTSSLSSHEQRLAALATKRQRLDALSEEGALEALLSDPEAAALTHSFPEEDFFLFMHRIGADDFLPVLALASDRQWQFVLDMECWQKDMPDYGAMGLWFRRFLKASPARFVKFLLEEEGDLMDAWLFRNVEVRIREHDEDPSDFPDGFTTLDDVLYFRLRPLSEEWTEDAEKSEAREEAVFSFVRHLAEISHPLFFRVFQEMAWALPAEQEEAALHWHRVRMAEKGFASQQEARLLWVPLAEGELEKQGRKHLNRAPDGDWRFTLPEHGRRMAEDRIFSEALELLDMGDVLADLHLELAHLCNRFVAAQGRVIRSREALDAMGQAVMGYLEAGIARITGEESPTPLLRAQILRTYRLDAVFRAGFGPVMRLKWRVQAWWPEAWFRKSGLALSFWEEQGMGILGGLLLEVPLCLDMNAASGRLYRPFASDAEIRETEKTVSDLMTLDDLLALLGLSSVDPMGRLLTWKNLLLTLWAKDSLDPGEVAAVLTPLHEERFRSFFVRIREERVGGFFLSPASRDAFLLWLSDRTRLDREQIADRVGGILEALFQELDGELAAIRPEALDHRYVRLFLLRPA